MKQIVDIRPFELLTHQTRLEEKKCAPAMLPCARRNPVCLKETEISDKVSLQ